MWQAPRQLLPIRFADTPFYELARRIGALIAQHQVVAIGPVIGLEELGVPLPVPGDVFIVYAGYLVSRGQMAFWPAVAAIVACVVAGSSGLYWLARRLGSNLMVRYGRVIRVDEQRMRRMERLFQRYGIPVIVIGRYVPGMRIVVSALAGALRVSYPAFALSVAASSFVWAVALLELGQAVGPRVEDWMNITPYHLLTWVLLLAIVVALVVFAWRHSRRKPTQNLPT